MTHTPLRMYSVSTALGGRINGVYSYRVFGEDMNKSLMSYFYDDDADDADDDDDDDNA